MKWYKRVMIEKKSKRKKLLLIIIDFKSFIVLSKLVE